MRTSRASMRNNWVAIGYRAFGSRIELAKVLTGSETTDRLIRIGFEGAEAGITLPTACRRGAKEQAKLLTEASQ